MHRPTARRAVVALAVSGSVAVAAMPALAQTVSPDPAPITVMLSVPEGDRLFDVVDMAGAPLTELDFRSDQDGRLPFQTVVDDQLVHVQTPGYHVNAVMTNLYHVKDDGTLDLTTKVPSSDISLAFGNPLAVPSLQLPVDPRVLLSGSLSDCSALGLTEAQILADAVLVVLCPLLSTTPLALPTGAAAPVATGAQQVVDKAALVAAAGGPLDLTKLPFALTGQDHFGPFTAPDRYDVAPYDDQVDDSLATAKRVMTGTPAALDTIEGLVDAVLDGRIVSGALDVLPTDATPSLLTQEQLLNALQDVPALRDVVALIRQLDDAAIDTLLAGVTGEVVDVVLSTVTAQYVSNPVLVAEPSAPKAGEYRGRLTVTFFQE